MTYFIFYFLDCIIKCKATATNGKLNDKNFTSISFMAQHATHM